MRYVLIAIFGLVASVSFAESSVLSYEQAEALFQENRHKPQFTEYALKFLEFNNTNHIDEKNKCYKPGIGVVKMILVINADGVVESVITDQANEKSECFKRSYQGLKAGNPPYAPFFISMSMQ